MLFPLISIRNFIKCSFYRPRAYRESSKLLPPPRRRFCSVRPNYPRNFIEMKSRGLRLELLGYRGLFSEFGSLGNKL
jgi:hypothetical protein